MLGVTALFVFTNQPNSGSIVVSMGLMQLLKSRFGRVGFFRPVVEDGPGEDADIAFMIERFSLRQRYEESYGLRKESLESLLAEGKRTEAVESIIAWLETLRASNDVVLIEGISPSLLPPGFGFEFNIEIARHLDAEVLSLINARGKTLHEARNEATIESDTLKTHGVREFMTIINRLSPAHLPSPGDPEPGERLRCYLPEIDELDVITVNDVRVALGCEVLFGTRDDLNRIVSTKLVAAMTSGEFLEHLREKALVIVPADRSDILTATVLALYSKTVPNVAGIVLSGAMKLPSSIETLLRGLESFSLPILSTPMDTYQTVSEIQAIRPAITPASERKIALATGAFFERVDVDAILSRLSSHTEHTMTPEMFQYTLFERARRSKKRIVLPESGDERILRAAEIILRRGVADIIFLGRPDEIAHRAGVLGLDLGGASIVDPEESPLREEFAEHLYQLRRAKGMQRDAAAEAMGHGTYFGTMMVQTGRADGMVSGAVHTTADTIRPALQIIKTRPGISIVSSVFFMCLETRVLIYGDCAVNENPDADHLAQIALSSARTAQSFGLSPRVAMLSYSTGESGSGEDVVKVREATRLVRSADPALPVEGPIQYDAAIDPEVAALKLPGSEVAGKATVFIFPDLNTGNNTYKAVQRSAGAIAIGPVLQGLNRPVNDLSRGCSVEDIVNTVAITAIQAEERP